MKKLVEMNTDEVCEALCELTPIITDIAMDKDFLEKLTDSTGINENSSLEDKMKKGAEKINTIVPLILKEKKDALYTILAIINGVNKEEIASQNGLKTISQAIATFKDEELRSFFTSFFTLKVEE